MIQISIDFEHFWFGDGAIVKIYDLVFSFDKYLGNFELKIRRWKES